VVSGTTQSIEWYLHFQRPWVTFDPDFKVMTFFDIEYLNKKLSWCWQIRATRLEVIVSSCATVTLALRHAIFYDSRLQKYVVTLKSGLEVIQSHWKRYHSIHRVWFPISVQCSIETLSLTCTVFRYSPSVIPWPWNLSQWSLKDRAHMTSYWRCIVTIALSGVVSEIFNVEKCRDLEIGVKGHWRSLRVVSFDRLCIVSY